MGEIRQRKIKYYGGKIRRKKILLGLKERGKIMGKKKGEWLWEKEERGKNYGGKKNVGKIKVEKRETIMVWKRKSNI